MVKGDMVSHPQGRMSNCASSSSVVMIRLFDLHVNIVLFLNGRGHNGPSPHAAGVVQINSDKHLTTSINGNQL